jgi:hypothetical protein
MTSQWNRWRIAMCTGCTAPIDAYVPIPALYVRSSAAGAYILNAVPTLLPLAGLAALPSLANNVRFVS